MVRQDELRVLNFKRIKCKSLRVHWRDSPYGTHRYLFPYCVDLILVAFVLLWLASLKLRVGWKENLEISRVQLAMYQTDNQTMLFVTLCAYPNWQKTSTVQSVFFMSANGQAASVSLLSRRLCSGLCSFPHCRADLVPDLTTVLIEYRPLGIPIGPYAESMLWNPCWESGTPTSVAHWVLQ